MQDVNHQLFTESVRNEIMLSMLKKDPAFCDELLDQLDLSEYGEYHPMALSGGQKQRVAIASAIAAGAELLLFDEPTSGLDHVHMKAVSTLIRQLVNDGKTVIISTHDQELIESCCDCIIQLAEGKLKEYKKLQKSKEIIQ